MQQLDQLYGRRPHGKQQPHDVAGSSKTQKKKRKTNDPSKPINLLFAKDADSNKDANHLSSDDDDNSSSNADEVDTEEEMEVSSVKT